MLDKIEKFKQKITSFQVTYQHPNAYRISNLLDRLIVRMAHHLFDTQFFMVLCNKRSLGSEHRPLFTILHLLQRERSRKHNGWQSPFARLNQQRYHKNWLHNLLVSAHRAERKRSPPNPL